MATVNEKMTAIADAIRNKTLETEALTLDDMAEKISLVSDLGYLRGKDDGYAEGNTRGYSLGTADEKQVWWEMITSTTNHEYRFRNTNWTNKPFDPPSAIKPAYAGSMFENTVGLKKLSNQQIDFSDCYGFNRIFSGSQVEELPVIDMSKSTQTVQNIFNGASFLHTIEKIILKNGGSQTFNDACFNNIPELQNVIFEGIFVSNISFAQSSKLTFDSLWSIIEALKDYSGTGTTRTLTLHADSKAKLGVADIAYATNKGWTIA